VLIFLLAHSKRDRGRNNRSLERLEKWGWIIAIITGLSALAGFNLHDLQPFAYGTLFFVGFYTFVIGFLIVFFRVQIKSWYSAPELMGRKWRLTLISTFVFSMFGVSFMIAAYPNYPSLMSQVGDVMYTIAQVSFLICIRKIGQIRRGYE
jgi:hypothetical protein